MLVYMVKLVHDEEMELVHKLEKNAKTLPTGEIVPRWT